MPVSLLFDNVEQRGIVVRTVVDGVKTNAKLEGDSLTSAALISILTDGQADEGDQLPDESGDRRGWWGDSFAKPTGDRIGSKVWIHAEQGKTDPRSVRKVAEAANDSLAWMVEDGVAVRTEVEGQRLSHGVVGFQVRMLKPGNPAPQWEEFWLEVQF